MKWSRADTLALAQQSCTHCFGLGLRLGRKEKDTPCNCVFRAIFRACYQRFRLAATSERYISIASIESSRCGPARNMWSFKDEEYAADFCLVAQRSLTLRQHRLFRWHFLLGADWKICCAKENMDRGSFFHEIYRIEQRLGKAFRELEPYALFPLDEYFRATPRASNYERSLGSVDLILECGSCDAELLPKRGRPRLMDELEQGRGPAPQRASFFPLKKRKKRTPQTSKTNTSTTASAAPGSSGD